MADKFTEFAGRMGKAPKGVGTGLKLLAAAAAVAYGVKESIYTGNLLYVFGAQVSMKSSYCFCMMQDRCDIFKLIYFLADCLTVPCKSIKIRS